MSIHLATGNDGFPKPKCRYCGCSLVSAIGVPPECRVLHRTSLSVLLMFNQFAMIRVPVVSGNEDSSNSSFKVTIVAMAQFQSLLKLTPTIVNCRPYVCFRDKPCYIIFINEVTNDNVYCNIYA